MGPSEGPRMMDRGWLEGGLKSKIENRYMLSFFDMDSAMVPESSYGRGQGWLGWLTPGPFPIDTGFLKFPRVRLGSSHPSHPRREKRENWRKIQAGNRNQTNMQRNRVFEPKPPQATLKPPFWLFFVRVEGLGICQTNTVFRRYEYVKVVIRTNGTAEGTKEGRE
jgi:hypothetical protein